MRFRFIILILILSFQTIIAQIGTIKDGDGWTNVRKEPNGRSEVIHKINEGELFWIEFEFDFEKSEWIEIYIPKSRFCKNGYQEKLITGYIHKSRLLVIDELPEYKGDDLKFEYLLKEFDKIEYKNRKSTDSISDKYMWGTDGYLPNYEVESIKISLKGIQIPISPKLFEDLFEIRKEFRIFKINNLFIVYNWNGDGAGYYELAWVINETGVIQRLVGSMI